MQRLHAEKKEIEKIARECKEENEILKSSLVDIVNRMDAAQMINDTAQLYSQGGALIPEDVAAELEQYADNQKRRLEKAVIDLSE